MKEKVDLNNKTILITGTAGFIGFHLVRRLLSETDNSTIVGIDNMNDYNPVSLKQWRLEQVYADSESTLSNSRFLFKKGDISDMIFVNDIFK